MVRKANESNEEDLSQIERASSHSYGRNTTTHRSVRCLIIQNHLIIKYGERERER